MPSPKRKRPVPSALGWAFWLFFIILTILTALWILRPLKKPPQITSRAPSKTKKKVSRPHPEARKRKPYHPACIIIDDMGQNPGLEREFFRLGLVLNFSFLPEAPFTKRLATEAYARGFEVLVHLPLEARKVRDHSHFISLRLNEVEVKRRVREAIKRVPYAIGVNHHMGSAFTADRKHMRWVLEEVKKLGLFYVDSRTTRKTVIPELARELHLPFAERRIFLDHQKGYQMVCKALEKFLERARKEPVLAIAHPHPYTLKALRVFRPRLKKEITLVPVSVFVKKGKFYD